MRYRFCEKILRKLIFRLKSKLYFGSLKPHPFDQIDPNGNAQYCLNKEGSVSIRLGPISFPSPSCYSYKLAYLVKLRFDRAHGGTNH